MRVYIGTYTSGSSRGIHLCEMHPESGALSEPRLVAETTNPSFLAVHPSRRYLYAVNEVESGSVSAFAVDPMTGGLTLLNIKDSAGADPCHLVVDRTGSHVLIANYGSGSVSVLQIEANGMLGRQTAFIQHRGSSVVASRQSGPHAHSVNPDQSNRLVAVADLGMDRLMVHAYDPAAGTLTHHEPAYYATAAGQGPRHMAYHPTASFAYLLNELGNTIDVLRYDAVEGAFTLRQSVSTLPDDFRGANLAAAVVAHPSGRFVHASNRGHDSIVTYRVDAKKAGTLSYVGHQCQAIKTPRALSIDPTGAFLLVANQGGDTVATFQLDPETGEPRLLTSEARVGTPVCIQFG